MTSSDWSFILAPCCFFRGKDVVQVCSCFDFCVSLNSGHPKLAHVSIETHGDLGGSMGIPHFKNPPCGFHGAHTSPNLLRPFSSAGIPSPRSLHPKQTAADSTRIPHGSDQRFTPRMEQAVLPTPHKQCFISSCERGVYLGNEQNPGAGYLII